MSFINEIKAVLIPKEIVFKEMKVESQGIYTFVFESEKPLEWTAGKHAMFFITHKKINKSMRLFSISSSPSEKVISITTKIGENPSEYKKALLELKPNMKMILRGPMGPFEIRQNSTNCFIAGGIGITPFRSMKKEIEFNKNDFNGNVKLLYINSDESFLFNEELKAIESSNNSTEFFTDRVELKNRIIQMTAQNENITYFISGTKNMTNSIKELLIENGIKKKDIKIDTFIGY